MRLRIARSDWLSFRLMIVFVLVLVGPGSVVSETTHDELKSHRLMSLRNWMSLRSARSGLSLMSLTSGHDRYLHGGFQKSKIRIVS